jgi:hypothetical protein
VTHHLKQIGTIHKLRGIAASKCIEIETLIERIENILQELDRSGNNKSLEVKRIIKQHI